MGRPRKRLRRGWSRRRVMQRVTAVSARAGRDAMSEQRVVRIEMVDVLGRDELVADEQGGRGLPVGQDIEGQLDEAVSVPVGEEADGRDEGTAWLSQLCPRVRL